MKAGICAHKYIHKTTFLAVMTMKLRLRKPTRKNLQQTLPNLQIAREINTELLDWIRM